VNSFLDRFHESRSVAEQIINDACDAPQEAESYFAELKQLYLKKVGNAGLNDCIVAIMYSNYVRCVLILRDGQEPLPVGEMERNTVQDTNSSIITSMSVDSK
jgi:hypothetical protein